MNVKRPFDAASLNIPPPKNNFIKSRPKDPDREINDLYSGIGKLEKRIKGKEDIIAGLEKDVDELRPKRAKFDKAGKISGITALATLGLTLAVGSILPIVAIPSAIVNFTSLVLMGIFQMKDHKYGHKISDMQSRISDTRRRNSYDEELKGKYESRIKNLKAKKEKAKAETETNARKQMGEMAESCNMEQSGKRKRIADGGRYVDVGGVKVWKSNFHKYQ